MPLRKEFNFWHVSLLFLSLASYAFLVLDYPFIMTSSNIFRMSYPDYTQRAEDHQCLLVLVQQVGTSINKQTFHRLYERVCRTQFVRIHRNQRIVWLRYKQEYPIENNEWGDFQAHRKVLGLLCFGQCDSDQSISSLQQRYQEVKSEYCNTVFDSRLILFNRERASPESDVETAPVSKTNKKNTSAAGATLIRTNADVDPLTCPDQFEGVDQNLNGTESSYSTSAAVTLNVQDLDKQLLVQNGRKGNNNNNKKTNGKISRLKTGKIDCVSRLTSNI